MAGMLRLGRMNSLMGVEILCHQGLNLQLDPKGIGTMKMTGNYLSYRQYTSINFSRCSNDSKLGQNCKAKLVYKF